MILDFELLWRGQRCPAAIAHDLDKAVADPRIACPEDRLPIPNPHDPGTLDHWYQNYQENTVRDLVFQNLPHARLIEGESYYALEGETWREIGWFQSMGQQHPASIRQSLDQVLTTKSWSDVLNQIPIVANARVSHQSLYGHFDLLVYFKNAWHGILIRSSNKIKDNHIAEAEFSKWVFSQAGIAMGSVFLIHPSETYSHRENNDPLMQLRLDCLNSAVKHLRYPLSQAVQSIIEMAAKNQGCQRRSCPFCAAYLPALPEHSIYTLHKGGKAVQLLEAEGIFDLLNIEQASPVSLAELNNKHRIQIQALKTEQQVINIPLIQKFLKELVFPIHFMDFECYSQALCPFTTTHPWELVPFLLSLQKLANFDQLDADLSETALFHAQPGQDGRRLIAEALCSNIEPKGSVVGYGMALERTVVNRLAALFPDLRPTLLGILSRMVDLQEPFFNFDYYHPKQKGKISLKIILPLLSGLNHANLALQSGGQAHLYWAYLSDQKLTVHLDKRNYIEDIRTYAALDARGLVDVFSRIITPSLADK